MGSRDSDHKTHHQPLLSSLVVRPSNSDSGGGEGVSGGRAGGGDYEPGEVHHDPPPNYSRSDRYSDDHGYRLRAGSVSPGHRRNTERRYSPGFDHPPRGRDFGSRREPGRYRDFSPPYGRGRGRGGGRGRPFGRGFDGPGLGPGPFRGDGPSRNNPNVRPRDGDWYCPDPGCNNLNFARRDNCNNCHRPRYGYRGSPPRRGHPGPLPPPYAPPRRFPGPPLDRSPVRPLNGFRSPPRPWAQDGHRDFAPGALPPPRHEGRFSDEYMRRDRPDYIEDGYRGRDKFDDRPLPMEWGHRDRAREGFLGERKGFGRQPLSPPLLPPPSLPPTHDRWVRDVRERSRSPIGGGLPPKDYHRDMYLERGGGDRRGGGRDRIGGAY